MAKKKSIDPKAKAKRQKIIAGVGGVLLLGLLAFQIPKTMKMLNQNQNQAASTTTSTSTTPTSSAPLAPPSLDGTAPSAPAASASSSGLADAAAAPATSGQLVSFSRFRTKDPFAQQVKADCGTNCAASGTSTPVTPAASRPTAPVAPTTVAVTPTPSAPATAPTTATISVDGVPSVVRAGASFPQSQALFQLVSLTRTTAKITVVGGSFEGGAPALVLTKGKQVTLMNTADGVRYVLKLLAVGS